MNLKNNVSCIFLDCEDDIMGHVMFMCEREDCKDTYLFGNKHKRNYRKRTSGEVVIKILLMRDGGYDTKMERVLMPWYLGRKQM
jgi:hypothetical protein